MNNIHRTANRYYLAFESFGAVIHFRSLWIYLFLSSASLMIYFMMAFAFSFDTYFIRLNRTTCMILTFVFEAVALGTWAALQSKNKNHIISSMQKRLNSDSDSMSDLKIEWFAKTIAAKREEYLSLAKDLDTFLDLKDRHRSSIHFTNRQMFDLLFSKESKNRTLAIFMGLSAATIALCIAGGTNIDTIFQLLEVNNLYFLLYMAFIVSLLVMGFYLVFRYTVLLLYIGLENLGHKLDGLNSRSNRRVQMLINQLLDLHQIKKARVRVRGKLKPNLKS